MFASVGKFLRREFVAAWPVSLLCGRIPACDWSMPIHLTLAGLWLARVAATRGEDPRSTGRGLKSKQRRRRNTDGTCRVLDGPPQWQSYRHAQLARLPQAGQNRHSSPTPQRFENARGRPAASHNDHQPHWPGHARDGARASRRRSVQTLTCNAHMVEVFTRGSLRPKGHSGLRSAKL